MRKSFPVCAIIFMLVPAVWADDPCVVCHRMTTPNIVLDWKASKHAGGEVGCAVCHGDGHNSPANLCEPYPSVR